MSMVYHKDIRIKVYHKDMPGISQGYNFKKRYGTNP
jgi:hypothetical protein